MRKVISILIFAAMVCCCNCSCTRIDAGHEGIKVNLYGSNKGVDDVQLVTGWVWFNPVTTAVYEYPTFVQTVDYPSFTINAKDGGAFSVDPTINVNLIPGKASEVFVKYRRPMNEVTEEVLYTHIKNAYRIKLSNYTTDEIVSKREEFEKVTEDYLREVLNNENFELGEMTSGLKYPETLERAIIEKTEAIQRSQKAQNELELAKAEAEKLLVKARAEKEANELRTKGLTPAVLEQMWVEKWNGVLPVYGEVPTLFKDISK